MTRKWPKILAAKALLGLGDQATLREIKAAYRKRAKEYHPDLAREGGEGTSMQEINAAYAVLIDYCSAYRFPLLPPQDAAEPMDDEEWWLNRFGEDPLWGRKRPE